MKDSSDRKQNAKQGILDENAHLPNCQAKELT